MRPLLPQYAVAEKERVSRFRQEARAVSALDSNTSVPISQQPDLSYEVPVFSPDSQSIYVGLREGARSLNKLVRMSILEGVMTDLIKDINSPVTFSPDGKQLAFLRREGEAS